MDTARFIRDSAARGLSKTATREALGYSRERFAAALEQAGAVIWPGHGQSVDERRIYEQRRGICTEASRRALEQARAARRHGAPPGQ